MVRPKSDAFTGIIDRILDAYKLVSKTQRHTSKWVFERLRDAYGIGGGITIVKNYINGACYPQSGMFVPLLHPQGHAQADFGRALAVICDIERKIYFLVMDLPHSDEYFLKTYPAETMEAFCDAQVAFSYSIAVCLCRFCKTTHGLPLLVFWEMESVKEPVRSLSWYIVTFLRIALAARAKGMIRARSKEWWNTHAATSWCTSPGLPVLMISTPIWLNNTVGAWATSCTIKKAKLTNALNVMLNGFSPSQLFLMTPVTSNLFG